MITSREEWARQVPDSIKLDGLWTLDVYQSALFLSDLAWYDCGKLQAHSLGKPIAWQLVRSSGSIAANMEEGYGRGYGRDYGRFLKIALGSARETRGWYYRSRHVLVQPVIHHRISLCDQIIGSLVTLVQQQSK